MKKIDVVIPVFNEGMRRWLLLRSGSDIKKTETHYKNGKKDGLDTSWWDQTGAKLGSSLLEV